MRLRRFVHDAILSIGFFTLTLTPYQLLWTGMSWEEYGRWCAGNIGLSIVLGPLLLALMRWVSDS